MTFRLLPEDEEYRSKLREKVATTIFVPSSPIRLRDQLRGREKAFARTIETLNVPGRSAFIYGERGVGKSSLALTAAYQFNSSDQEPIRVVCHPTITFGRLVGQIAKRMHDQLGDGKKPKKTTELGLKTSLVTLLHKIESSTEPPPSTIDVNDAVDLLEGLLPKRPNVQRVVVIDELDATPDPTFRSDIAYFIKQLGDRQARLRFIFAGIGTNISELLVHHESAQRCMATIQLERLGLNVLRDIVVEGFRQIDMTVNDNIAYRITSMSDGFAHFTHLIALKMALSALDEEALPENVNNSTLLEEAIGAAVADSEAIVKEAYDRAVQKYASYEPVLWAVADHWELFRSTREIFNSYQRICEELRRKGEHVEEVDKSKLTRMLYNLRQRPHGEALVSNRKSWFKIRVSMLRGYCRMVAGSKGIDVGLDYQQSERPRAAMSSVPSAPRVSDGDDDNDDEIESDDDGFGSSVEELAPDGEDGVEHEEPTEHSARTTKG